jgi:hypothetical protein
MFLNGCQIVEKAERDANTGGFEPTDGFDGSDYQAQPATSTAADTSDEEDLPF